MNGTKKHILYASTNGLATLGGKVNHKKTQGNEGIHFHLFG